MTDTFSDIAQDFDVAEVRSTRSSRGGSSQVSTQRSSSGAPRTPGQTTTRTSGQTTKFDYSKEGHSGDVNAVLQEQLADERYTEMRADLGAQFVENLAIPSFGDAAVPGYKMITKALADEYGLAGADGDEEDFDFDFPPDEPTPEESAAIDGNLIHTFVEGIKGQHLYDTLNATLLAQLHANFRYDRATEPVPWTRVYSSVLENIGWVVPAYDFRQLTSRATRFSMDSAIIKVVTSIMTADAVEVVRAGLEALKELNAEDRRLTIWRKNSVTTNNGNFQVTGAGESAAGILQMYLTAYHFKTDEAVTDVLWFRFNSGSTRLDATRTTLVLNDQVYDRLRDAVLNRLGNRGLKYVARLPLGDE